MEENKAQKELAEFEEVFKALSHRSRRHILAVLNARSEMTAGEVVERFSCSWPTTTRHLKLLQSAGLVSFEKRGRESVYRINKIKLNRVVKGWLKWFEED